MQRAWAPLFLQGNQKQHSPPPAQGLYPPLTAALFCVPVSYVLLENCFSTFFFHIIQGHLFLSCILYILPRFIINHPKVNFQNEGKGFNNLTCEKTKCYYLSDHVFVAPVHPVPEGTVTEVCGAAASTRDSRRSTGVRSARKQQSVEQGTYNSST